MGCAALSCSDDGGLLIASSAVCQDGKSASLTAPNGGAQVKLLAAAVSRAGLTNGELGLVEAHGTGTALGDPTEAGALAAVHIARPDALSIGAAKANVGHTEAVSGQIGLLKLRLLLDASMVVGNAQLRTLNPLVHECLLSLLLV